MDNSAKAIGQRIRIIRNKLRLTQKGFAKLLAVSDKAVSTYEVGDVVPPIDTLKQIVTLGNTSCDWLILGFEHVAEKGISEIEKNLIQGFRQIDNDDRVVILRVLENAVIRKKGE